MITIAEFYQHLSDVTELRFFMPDGTEIPNHFHVTEVGVMHRKFLDCGGVMRETSWVHFQLWVATDVDHRLKPQKLIQIIDQTQSKIPFGNVPLEIEFQGDTIGRYDVALHLNGFQLKAKQTACLAEDACGVPAVKPRIRLSVLGNSCC